MFPNVMMMLCSTIYHNYMQEDVVCGGSMIPVLEYHSTTEKKPRKVLNCMYACIRILFSNFPISIIGYLQCRLLRTCISQHLSLPFPFPFPLSLSLAAYKALAGEGSMCGKPFTITPYELHTCTTATKTMPLSQAVEQAMECQSTLLGKRKIPGGDGQTEENGT